jgi:hypothetical protein
MWGQMRGPPQYQAYAQAQPLRVGTFIQLQHASTGLWLHQVRSKNSSTVGAANSNSGSNSSTAASSLDSASGVQLTVGTGCDEKEYLRIMAIHPSEQQCVQHILWARDCGKQRFVAIRRSVSEGIPVSDKDVGQFCAVLEDLTLMLAAAANEQQQLLPVR